MPRGHAPGRANPSLCPGHCKHGTVAPTGAVCPGDGPTQKGSGLGLPGRPARWISDSPASPSPSQLLGEIEDAPIATHICTFVYWLVT